MVQVPSRGGKGRPPLTTVKWKGVIWRVSCSVINGPARLARGRAGKLCPSCTVSEQRVGGVRGDRSARGAGPAELRPHGVFAGLFDWPPLGCLTVTLKVGVSVCLEGFLKGFIVLS